MVSLLPDHPEENEVFTTDTSIALKELTDTVCNEFSDIIFQFKIFRTFWFPTHEDMSATLQVRFDSTKLCDECRYRFEKLVYRMYFKVGNKSRRAKVSFNGKYMDTGLAVYELQLYSTIHDCKKE